MNLILLLGGCFGVLFVFDYLLRGRPKRPHMSDQQIWVSFLADEGLDRGKALLLWYEIAAAMNISPGVMRPDDRLSSYEPKGSGEMTPYLDSLVARAEKHVALLGRPIDLSSVVTVRQYIQAFHDTV